MATGIVGREVRFGIAVALERVPFVVGCMLALAAEVLGLERVWISS